MGTDLLTMPEIEWVQAERDLAITKFGELGCLIVQDTRDRLDNDNGNHNEPAKES